MQSFFFFFGVTVKTLTDKSLYSGVKSYLAFIFHICRGLVFVFSRWPVLVGFISRVSASIHSRLDNFDSFTMFILYCYGLVTVAL
ncbi:hypothetical protein BDE02_05G058200 [Populus trichocarpa]|nr:hypothetical protein BDE02_05G058200 [Populus trichocarpa]